MVVWLGLLGAVYVGFQPVIDMSLDGVNIHVKVRVKSIQNSRKCEKRLKLKKKAEKLKKRNCCMELKIFGVFLEKYWNFLTFFMVCYLLTTESESTFQ